MDIKSLVMTSRMSRMGTTKVPSHRPTDVYILIPSQAILTADNNGEPSDDRGRPLDPLNISDADRLKLDGLIIDNVRILS